MNSLAKTFVLLGVIFLLIGLFLTVGARFKLGRLPGDIIIKKENFTFYFPLMTCIILSIILSAFFWLYRFFSGH
ncbi:MAG: DUF2905 domain-containing protein [Firmicutes bacterium]|nr:DUF2905 domain-containing protein [Bacillota bacterium]